MVRLELSESHEGRALRLCFSCEPEDSRFSFVEIACQGVIHARLPEFHPCAFVDEVEVEDIGKGQIEGANFRIKDFGSSGLDVTCHSFRFSLDVVTSEANRSLPLI